MRGTPPPLYHYPSGKQFLEDGPINRRDSIAHMVESGFAYEEIKNEFIELDDALFLQDNEKVEHARLKWNKRLNLDLSANDVRELYGVGNYIYFNTVDSARYAYQREFRKRTMDHLGEGHPDAIRALVRQCFFELGVDREQAMLLTQLGNVGERRSWNMRPWDEITQETRLGIFDLDVTTLHEEDLERLRALYDDVAKEEQNDTDHERIVYAMAELRVRQLGV